MKLHVLHCGYIRVDKSADFGNSVDLKSLRWLADMEKDPGCVKILCSHDADIAPQVIEY